MERKIYANTYEFLGVVFDKSVEQLMERGGQRDLNVLYDPPQDTDNEVMGHSMVWVHKAAVITFPNDNAIPNSQYSLSVIQNNFYENLCRWEFNLSDQALTTGLYLDTKTPQRLLYNMHKAAWGTGQGLGMWLDGEIGTSDLAISDDVNPNQFYPNEINTPIIGLLNQMKSLVSTVNLFPINKRINEAVVMDACISYVNLIRQRSAVTIAQLDKHQVKK